MMIVCVSCTVQSCVCAAMFFIVDLEKLLCLYYIMLYYYKLLWLIKFISQGSTQDDLSGG